ncbi:rho GTPase-activating protein 25 [Synchiropus picturatus]
MSLKLPRNWDFSTFKAETARIVRSRSVLSGEGGSCRSMERPLKAGWLKKQQRSLVKNWQQRYFVLRGSTLTYHKDDKETTIQGFIQLQFSKVNELPPNSDDPGKYLFEIVPRANGERERCPYVLMANSQSDMEEWVRSLRRVIGAPSSGVFGKSLVDTVTYEQRSGPHMVPLLVQKCVEFIREHGLEEEGIFRLPGQENAVKHFRDAFDAGERPSFPSDTDVHTVASLLKLYLRELPEPVVPWTQYQDFLDCTNKLDLRDHEGRRNLEKQISLLPRVNYNLLSYVCRFLFEVQLHSAVNKMNVENLATVMGINLLKPQIEDPFSVMKATPQIQSLMTVMIRQHETLFPLSKDQAPSPQPNATESQKNTPRSFVGWGSTEIVDTSPTDYSTEDRKSAALQRENSSTSDGPKQQSCSSPEENFQSPRKRTQTLPVFNCPLTGMAAKTDAINRWGRFHESVEEKSGTLSEDIFRILDLKTSGLFFSGPPTSSCEAQTKAPAQSGSDKTGLNGAEIITTGSHTKTQGGAETGSSPQVKDVSLQEEPEQAVGSLEQQNKELRATVAELRTALEAERSRAATLEVSLKNAESSRDEALRRNLQLQSDIQQFLSQRPQAPT